MKHIHFLVAVFAACLMALACSKHGLSDFFQTKQKQPEAIIRSSTVTPEDVDTFIAERRGNPLTKNSVVYNLEPILCGQDTVMYLINYEDGWELISGDLRAGPIIMFCERGNIKRDELLSNPAQEDVLGGMSDYLDSLVTHPIIINEGIATKSNPNPPTSYYDENGRYWVLAYKQLISVNIETQNPLSGLRWGQGSTSSTSSYIWNVSMPYRSSAKTYHCLSGCGPVAAAQTLVYLHSKFGDPEKIYKTGSSSAYLSSTTSYVTTNIFNTSFSDYGNYWSTLPSSISGATSTQIRTASALMLYLGRKANAKYYYDYTSSSITGLKSALSYYGYSCTYSSSYVDVFRNQIYTNQLPIVAALTGIRNEGGTISDFNHDVIFEGYKKNTEVYRYVYKNGDNGTFEYQYQNYTFTYEYIAVNWGYNGSGEYDLSTGSVIWYDLGSTFRREFSGGYDRGTISGMLYNFTD